MTIHQKTRSTFKLSLPKGDWKHLLPEFESAAMAAKMRRAVVNALKKLELSHAKMDHCRPNNRCESGLCPSCVRRRRLALGEFFDSRQLIFIDWKFATIRVANWMKEPGDHTRFGPLAQHPDITKFVAELRKLRRRGLLVIGSIEAVYVTVGNKPEGKNFHIHVLISGLSLEQIREAAGAAFTLDNRVKNPVLVQPVDRQPRDLIKALTYVYKQPFWKKSKTDHGDVGRKQFPKPKELRELIRNYGEHRLDERLILEGVRWEGTKFSIVEQLLPDQLKIPYLPLNVKTVGEGGTVSGNTGIAEPQLKSDDGDLLSNDTVSAEGAHPVHPSKGTSIKLLRQIESLDDGTVSLFIQYPKNDGSVGQLSLPRETLVKSADFKSLLIGKGADASLNYKSAADTLLSQRAAVTIHSTATPGWHDNYFICHAGGWGNRPESVAEVIFAPSSDSYPLKGSTGDISTFLAGIHALFEQSDILLLAYLCALLPPLAMRLGVKSGFSVNLVGESTTGKTLTLRLAQAISSRAEEKDLQTFNLTPGALEPALRERSGSAVVFGDIKAAKEKGLGHVEKIQQLIFAVHGRDGRGTLHQREVPIPFCLVMLSDEISLEERYRQAKQKLETGDRVRCIELRIPSRDKGGVFNRLENPNDAMAAAQDLENLIDSAYGTVFPDWIAALAGKTVESLKSDFNAEAKRFTERLDILDGLGRRFSVSFGYLAATAKIAEAANLLSPKAKAGEALSRLFEDAAAGLRPEEIDLTIEFERLANFVDQKDKVPTASRGKALQEDTGAFFRNEGAVIHLYVRSEELGRVVGSKVEVFIAKLLDGGAVIRGKSGRTKNVKQKGIGRSRYLDIDYGKFLAIRAKL
ncbi:DUF927 domain-containing protein [Notoacmeibacter ruber]|uniref:DUF927 domain-containing protein n=1 Tax=Notoacmeibacter ruber TaxID=2670375 RepID=A0A3L7JL74_9HYPH|nr:DUF927 domain-containing protein [Notoacmeibacter ruber]RLQ89272.1 DUF927 domain-containing protein [Notoacmeibacter ruber]